MAVEEKERFRKRKRRRRSLVKTFQRQITLIALVIFAASAFLYLAFQNEEFKVLLDRSARNAAIGTQTAIQDVEGFEEYTASVMETFASIPEEVRQEGGEEYDAYFEPFKQSDVYLQATQKAKTLSDQLAFENVYLAAYDPVTQAYVILLDPEGGPIQFGYRLGEWMKADRPEIVSFFEDHNDNGSNSYIQQTDEKHQMDMLISGVPVRNAQGEVIAMAMAEMPLVMATIFAVFFTLMYFIVLLVIIIIIVILARVMMRRRIVVPIRKISRAVEQYAQNRKEGKVEGSTFADLNIRTRDELEELSQVMAGMETDIAVYEDDLMKAAAEKERISTELNVASRIQVNLLPTTFPAFPDRTEFEVYAAMDPAREVGGDFYDYFLIDENHLGLVIADVSGKGIPAALFMMASMIIVNSFAMEGYAPAQVLAKTNERICRGNREDMFVTAWFGILDIRTGVITAANAGHEYPTVRQPDGSFELIKDKHGFVLGGMEGMQYKEYTITLQPGATLFVYTDGVPEATNTHDELFGTDRMLQALNREPDREPERILHNVRREIDAFVQEAPQFDDLTMLCLRYYGPAEVQTGDGSVFDA